MRISDWSSDVCSSDLKFGSYLPDAFKQRAVKVQILLWVYPANNMHLGYRLAVISFYNVPDLFRAHHPAFVFLLQQTAIRTKFTSKYTKIGGFNVKIPVKVSVMAMHPFPDLVGQHPQESQASFFIQGHPFFKGNAVAIPYLQRNILDRKSTRLNSSH